MYIQGKQIISFISPLSVWYAIRVFEDELIMDIQEIKAKDQMNNSGKEMQ